MFNKSIGFSGIKFGVTGLSKFERIFSFIFIRMFIKFRSFFPSHLLIELYNNSTKLFSFINKLKNSFLSKHEINNELKHSNFNSFSVSFKSCKIFVIKSFFFSFKSFNESSLYVKILFTISAIDFLFKCFIKLSGMF